MVASNVSIAELEVDAEQLDFAAAAARYREHGCLVVRGLMRDHVAGMLRDVTRAAEQALALLDQARKTAEGWVTPDGALFLPAPAHYPRDKQIMIPAVNYKTSAACLHSALDARALDLIEAIVGPDVELFLDGQCLYKEPTGGHPKNLHQDAAYFEHRYEGPVAMLIYLVDTTLQNGALHVAPGSHRLGCLRHIDTFSHLGLDPAEWPWSRTVPVEGRAGDAVLFHVRTVHGSQENHSAAPRPVFIHRYRRADDFVVIGATTAANRAEAEKREAEARKENQQGWLVRGFRRFAPGGGAA